MHQKLTIKLRLVFIFFCASWLASAQTTVFNETFTTSAGSGYSTINGSIGNSSSWSMLRSGTDYGARIHNGILSLTNDATGAGNASGWVLAYTLSGIDAPYNPVLNSNAGLVTWSFNMRQSRSNPSGPASGSYGHAFILAGTSNTTATTGSGYAVLLGNNGKTDPLRLVRYTSGLRTSSPIMQSNTSGYTDFGNQYLSVRITYAPTTNTWSMYVRYDGGSFLNPASGNFAFQGSEVNSASTGIALPLMGAFWNAGTRKNQTAFFDNVRVSVAEPVITSLSPPTKIAGSPAFTLTVNGSNFSTGSIIRWNGSNRTTTFVSSTQLTTSISAADIATAGTATVTVVTGSVESNAVNFTIDPAGVPVISVSTMALANLSTVTGTPSAVQSFTVSGANLTGNITVAAPANFEVSTSSTTGFQNSIVLTATGGTVNTQTVYVRLKASAVPGVYSGSAISITSGTASRTVNVTGTVLTTEPTTAATTVTFTNVGASSATINWVNGNGSARLVVVRQGSAVNAAPVDGTSYNASTVFGSGSELGTGNYVVYASTGNSVTVTGLLPNTTYHVGVYEYNGSGGTQNYRPTGATGNTTTQPVPAGLQVATTNIVYTINFDETVDGVNNGTFAGGGLGTSPQPGELNSNSWSFTGFTDGAVNFGGTNNEDTVYDSGTSEGGETDAGVYAFQVAPDNYALGVQPGAGDFAPGTIIFRFQNQTGAPVTSLNVGYKVYVYNDEPGSNSFNFSHSANNSAYTSVTTLDHTSAAAEEAAPGWKAYYKVTTITGISIPAGSYYYLRWTGATASGTVFDEIALDDLVIVANPTSTFAPFNGTAETFVLNGNASLSGNTTVSGTISFNNNSRLIIGANTLTLNGPVTNNTAGGLRGSGSGSLVIGGSTSPTLSFDQTTPGTTNLFSNLSVITTADNTVTAANNLAVSGTLTVGAGQTLNLGTNTLTGALTTIVNNGTISTQNTGATPFTPGKTWGGEGLVLLNASAVQTLVAGTYNSVTVANAAGAVAGGDVTVNGNLNLPQPNPSATTGSFSTGIYTLFMGPDGINTGTGDVSGNITRNTGIVANKLFTFGHPNTSILFPPVGTLPSSMSLRLTLNQAPALKPDAILRTYDFIQTGGTGTKAVIRSHYVDSELNGNDEDRLVDWVTIPAGDPSVIEQGRSNYSTVENWVELTNVNVAFFTASFGNELLTMANAQAAVSVWDGSESSSWTTAANWTPLGTPSSTTAVIIPNAGTTPNDPILNVGNTEVKTLLIEPGGILNSDTASNLRIFGTVGAWINNGTFNPSTGTVTFETLDATVAGSTTFNNLTIASGASLRALEGNYMSIAGTLTKTGTLILGAFTNTVAYTGTNQTIVVPDGQLNAYNGLTINGTGAIFPASLNVTGDFTTNAAVNLTGTALTLNGLNPQVIGGTVSPSFSTLTINKPSGEAALGTNATVTGTLTLTSGILNIGDNDLTLGAAGVAGSFSATAMIAAGGEGVVRRPFTGTGSYLFPVGELADDTADYSPVTVDVTSGTFTNAFVEVNVRDGKHPDNNSTENYLTRYWNVQQTGIANSVAAITAQYTEADVTGSTEAISAAQLDGTFDLVTNPWEKFTVLSGTTLTAAGATLTEGQASAFTGITAQDVVALITGEGVFCEGEEVTLTGEVSGGDTPYNIEWSNGLGSALTATPPTDTPGIVTYTLTVRDANGIASTDTADVEVTAVSEPGVLSGNQAICSGAAPLSITLTDNVGNVVRWETSETSGFEQQQFISNTTSTITGAEIGNITSTTYVRAVVQNGSCDVVYTDPVSIAVVTTVWNGATWSNGAPDSSIAAVFEEDYTATTDIEACSIQVTNGADVIIPAGLNVIVDGAVNIMDGTFVLENNANLLQNNPNPTINTGEIIVEKNSSPLYRLDYTLWSSPVQGQNLLDFSSQTLPNRFYIYDTADDAYVAIDPAVNDFEVGTGYLIRVPNTHPDYVSDDIPGTIWTGYFEGVPHNGTLLIPVSTAGEGYNAVGNPYPSPINIHDFFDANIGTISQTSALYFWRKRNNPDETSYASITKLAYTANEADGGDTGSETFTGNPADWVINTAQGFYIQAIGTSLVFNNDMRRAVNNDQFFRMDPQGGQNPQLSRLWINMAGNSGEFSQAAVGYTSMTTLGLDYGWDGELLNDGAISLYSIAEGTDLSIQARAGFTATDVVPLGYTATMAGNYTMALDHFDGVFSQGQEIYLKDKLMGITHNIKESAYTFTTDAGNFEERFEIIYMNEALGTENPALSNHEVIVYKQGGALHFNAGKAVMNSIRIFDVRGRMIYSAPRVNSATFEISGLQVQEQVLIIHIGVEDSVVTKKVVY